MLKSHLPGVSLFTLSFFFPGTEGTKPPDSGRRRYDGSHILVASLFFSKIFFVEWFVVSNLKDEECLQTKDFDFPSWG